MKDDLIKKMINQHKQLKNLLGQIIKTLKDKKKFDKKLLSIQLSQFEAELNAHLYLENKEFYSELLEKMKIKKIDYKKTQVFIEQMKSLEDRIKKIFKKYKNLEINDNIRKEMVKEIDMLKELLLLRIESEEIGVYMYWEFLL